MLKIFQSIKPHSYFHIQLNKTHYKSNIYSKYKITLQTDHPITRCGHVIIAKTHPGQLAKEPQHEYCASNATKLE